MTELVPALRPVWSAFETFVFAMLRTSLTETFGQQRSFEMNECCVSARKQFDRNCVYSLEIWAPKLSWPVGSEK